MPPAGRASPGRVRRRPVGRRNDYPIAVDRQRVALVGRVGTEGRQPPRPRQPADLVVDRELDADGRSIGPGAPAAGVTSTPVRRPMSEQNRSTMGATPLSV